jgi:hypothetical protein
VHEPLLAELNAAGALDRSRAVIDSSQVRAVKGGLAPTAGVEESLALLHWFRRLRIRWEIRDDIHEAFLCLACAIICWRRLGNLSLC